MYDALNVLMAMDIISKDKKEIRWQGLPSAPADRAERLKAERGRLRTRLLQQHAYLRARAPEPCCPAAAAACCTGVHSGVWVCCPAYPTRHRMHAYAARQARPPAHAPAAAARVPAGARP